MLFSRLGTPAPLLYGRRPAATARVIHCRFGAGNWAYSKKEYVFAKKIKKRGTGVAGWNCFCNFTEI